MLITMSTSHFSAEKFFHLFSRKSVFRKCVKQAIHDFEVSRPNRIKPSRTHVHTSISKHMARLKQLAKQISTSSSRNGVVLKCMHWLIQQWEVSNQDHYKTFNHNVPHAISMLVSNVVKVEPMRIDFPQRSNAHKDHITKSTEKHLSCRSPSPVGLSVPCPAARIYTTCIIPCVIHYVYYTTFYYTTCIYGVYYTAAGQGTVL